MRYRTLRLRRLRVHLPNGRELSEPDSLYKAGTPVVLSDDPRTGSKHVWIAKLRGGSEYVIVKSGTILRGSSGTSGETT